MNALETQKLAFLLLGYTQDKSGEHVLGFVDIEPFESEYGLSATASMAIVRYLEQKGLVDVIDDSRKTIQIRPFGVDQLAAALRDQSLPTQSFPAVNILQIGVMQAGQIQQGTDHSSQSDAPNSDLAAENARLKAEITALRAKLK